MSELTPAPKGYPIKLVRDRTAQIINQSDEPGDLFYRASDGDLTRLLKLKLGEEIAEYLIDGGRSELLDVLAVIEGLGALDNVDLETLIKEMREDPRGGFLQGIIMYGHHPEFDGGEI